MSTNQELRVLIVDDNSHMRSILLSILYSIDIKSIKEASNGEEAINIMEDWIPDIVIIDYLMSPVDGVEFTRQIRSSKNTNISLVPIIMMTGYTEKSRVIEARDSGVTEFIRKPITPKIVLERIHSIIYNPRSYTRSSNYFGPDRRRRRAADFAGPFKRASEPDTLATDTNALP